MHAKRSLAAAGLLFSAVAAVAGAQDETPPPAEPTPAQKEAADETAPADTATNDRAAEDATPEEATEEAPPPRDPFSGSAADLAAAYESVTLRTIGRSAGGRTLAMLTIGAPDAEWAALLVAGLHGRRDRDETRLALDVASWLAEHADELPQRTAFHIIADGSPDATAAAATWPRAGNDRPTDEDGDGDVDEDGPDDVNGDSRVSWMRYPDPTGAWSFDDDDVPRRAAPEKGTARTHRIVPEGRDDDDDGAFNEDGAGGVDVSRNFTWAFEEHTPLAGRWQASESETRAIMDVILADQRIALVYEIGGGDTIAKTPGWSGAWQKLPGDDSALLTGLSELHGDGPLEKRTSHAPGAGSFGGVVWHQLGRIWLGRAPAGRRGAVWPDGDAKWPAHLAVTWTAVSGEGLPPGAEVATISAKEDADAPPAVFAETASIGAFLRDAAAGRARVAFTDTVTAGGSGVLRLRTRLVNTGRLPTHTERGAALRARRPLNVRVRLPGDATLAGGRPLVTVARLAPGGSSDELAWVVAGPRGAVVRIEVSGPDTGTVVLEERIP